MTTTTVNVHEAKTQPSQLLQRIRLGEEVVIAKGCWGNLVRNPLL